MASKSIAHSRSYKKQKTSATTFWTAFGPHALSCGGLDLKRSTFRDAWLRPGPQVAARSPHARARSNPPTRFLVQDEEKGPLILQMARMSPVVVART